MKNFMCLNVFMFFVFIASSQITISIDKIRNEPTEPYLIFDVTIKNTSNGISQYELPLYSGEYYSLDARINLIAKTELDTIEIFPFRNWKENPPRICELEALEKYSTRMIVSKSQLLRFFEDYRNYNSLSFQVTLNTVPVLNNNSGTLIESNWVKTSNVSYDTSFNNWVDSIRNVDYPLRDLFYNCFIYPFTEENQLWYEKNLEYAHQFIQAFPKSIYSEWAKYFVLTYRYNNRDKGERNKFENGIKKLKYTKDILLKERIEKQIELNKYYEQLEHKTKK